MKQSFIPMPRGNHGWKKFKGENLPTNAEKLLENDNCPYSSWIYDSVFYKGDNPETAIDWIIVTNHGGYYKVGAEYMIWYTKKVSFDGFSAQAIWSYSHLKKSMRSLILTGETIFDPGYTT